MRRTPPIIRRAITCTNRVLINLHAALGPGATQQNKICQVARYGRRRRHACVTSKRTTAAQPWLLATTTWWSHAQQKPLINQFISFPMNIYPSLVFFMTKENQHHLIQCPPVIFLQSQEMHGRASKGGEKDIMRKYIKKGEIYCQSVGGDWRKETNRGCPSTLLAPWAHPHPTGPPHHIGQWASVLGHLSYCCRDYTTLHCSVLRHILDLDGQCERAMASCLPSFLPGTHT